MEEKRVCCFFGHRKIAEDKQFRTRLYTILEELILHENISVFLFGSKSDFDMLCREVVAELKEKYQYIWRVYVRAEYPYIDKEYETYLLQYFEETYYSQRAVNAGKAVYVERNRDMIDKSDICVVYYKEEYLPKIKNNRDITRHQPKSGTRIAYDYARSKKKEIIILN